MISSMGGYRCCHIQFWNMVIMEKEKRYVASISGGKDSMAMVLGLMEKGWPLTHCVYFDTGMEFSCIRKNIEKVRLELEQYGCELVILQPERHFLEEMLLRRIKCRDGSSHYGSYWCGGPCRWMTRLKINACEKYVKSLGATAVEYIGIAADESGRVKEKCPDLVLVPPNYDLYNRSSKALIKLLSEYTDKIEQYSIDEAFLDMTGCCQDPITTAYEIKNRVHAELGFTVNIGVSENKLLAKMASDFTKPDHVHTLWKSEMSEKMWHLPVGDLFYVGHASLYKLKKLGFHTIGELAAMDPAILRAHMKSQGILIWQYANGIDESAVISSPPPAKGYGNSLTTPYDVMDCETARQYLLSLSETISARLRADGVKISVVSISLKDWDLRFYGHQITLSVPTDLTLEIYAAACRCLSELWNGIPLRHLGIHTSRVSSDPFRQMQFFETIDYEKYRKMEKTVDQIRKRFGMDSIKRACFLPSAGSVEIDHMGGGVSREKRTVDYSQEKIL